MAEDPIPFDIQPPFGTSLLARWGIGLIFAVPGLFFGFFTAVSLLNIAMTEINDEAKVALGVAALGFALSAWFLCSVGYRIAALVSLRERRLLVLAAVATVLGVASAITNFVPVLFGLPGWLASLVVVWANLRGPAQGSGSGRASAAA